MEETIGATEQELAAPVEAQVQEDPQAQNWREVNKLLKDQKAAIERLAREKEELAYTLQKAFQKPQEEEEDEPIDPYSENFGSQLEKKVSRAIEKTYDKIEQKKKSDPAYLEEQARKKYSDFDRVMTSDNIDQIIKSNPLVHQSVMASGDPLAAAYAIITASAAFQNQQQKSNATQRIVAEERAKLADNQSKPKSPNAIPRSQTISGLSGFGRLTKEQAAEIHAETMRIKRGR